MTWIPAKGDRAVDLRVAARSWERDACGQEVTVKTVSETLVVTTDGERYSRAHLTPVSEGRYSARVLVQPHDPRVLCILGRRAVREVAQHAENLSGLNRSNPDDYIADLSAIIAGADRAKREFIQAMHASRKER